jgi:DNA polymerase-1
MSVHTEGYGPFYVTDKSEIKEILSLFKENVLCVAHNAKYDIVCLLRSGLVDDSPRYICDTMCLVNVLDENLSPSELGLKPTILREFNHKMIEFKDAISDGLHSEKFVEYAKEDAYWEYMLFQKKKQEIDRDSELKNYFFNVLMPGMNAFVDIEMNGMKWDLNHAMQCFNRFKQMRDKLLSDIKSVLGNIDLASPKQLQKRLFSELGYDTKYSHQNEKTGQWSTDAAVMEAMAGKYPVCKNISIYRTCEKMISTYLKPLTEQSSQNFDGRVRGSFWLASQTGRIRCSDDNLQNVPVYYNMPEGLKDVNIRDGFVAEDEFKYLVVDFSQIELRLCAQISRDPVFLSSFIDWKCTACGKSGKSPVILHSCPECGVKEDEGSMKGHCKGFWHGLDLHQITTDSIPALEGQRKYGKEANFALIYLATSYTMNGHFPMFSVDKWEKIIEQYFNKYKGVRSWHAKLEKQMCNTGVISDLFGRKRRIPKHELRQGRSRYKHCLNQFVNFPVQASAVALALICMAKCRNHFRSIGQWNADVRLVNMVHDELVFEIRETKMEEAKEKIISIMETSVSFDVPIRVDAKIVDRWGSSK